MDYANSKLATCFESIYDFLRRAISFDFLTTVYTKIFTPSLLRKLWGSHGGYVSNGKQVTGNFNGHLAALCFLFADEAIFAGDKQAANAIKSLITEDVISIERKGLDITQERSYLQIAMASNHDWMVDASADARRFCIFDLDIIPDNDVFFSETVTVVDYSKLENLECDYMDGFMGDETCTKSVADYMLGFDDYVQEVTQLHTHRYEIGADARQSSFSSSDLPIIQAKHFYIELHEEIGQTKVKEQFLFDMLTRDVTDFVPNRNIPQTKALREQKLNTLSGDSVSMWLLHFLEEEKGEIPEFDKEGNLVTVHNLFHDGISNKVLYDHYNCYCRKVDVRGYKLISPIHFGRDLSKKGVLSKRKTDGMYRSVKSEFLDSLKNTLGI